MAITSLSPQLVAGDVHPSSVHGPVTVQDELAGLPPRGRRNQVGRGRCRTGTPSVRSRFSPVMPGWREAFS